MQVLDPPLLLLPGESADLLDLRSRDEAWTKLGRILDSHVVLHTNVSAMTVKVLCFHGQLATVRGIFKFKQFGDVFIWEINICFQVCESQVRRRHK